VKVLPCFDAPISQAEFAQLIGVSEARVSQLLSENVLTRGETAHEWLLAYCDRLRDQAAGRAGLGGADLVLERALLTRSQREAQDLKNAVARGEYAPIGALADVLGMASSAVVDRMDQVEGQMRKACPDLPEEVRAIVLRVLADARNEWIRSTSRLLTDAVDALAQSDIDADAQPMSDIGEEELA
jgi:phage terminase Nu1 subunit (DNA packaging protein)